MPCDLLLRGIQNANLRIGSKQRERLANHCCPGRS
jgi:hypothetical protein